MPVENQVIEPVVNAAGTSGSVNNATTNVTTPVTPTPDNTYSKEFVEKVLKEKKNSVEALRAAEEKLSKHEKEKLVSQENYKELLTVSEKKTVELQDKLNSQTNLITNAKKLGALKSELQKLGMDPKYIADTAKLVDLEQVIVDEDNGVITGADLQAKRLADKFPPLFKTNNVGVSHQAPVGIGGELTLESWKKLPEKEQKDRYPELRQNLMVSNKT